MAEKQGTFFARVYEVVMQVPEGRVTTYGAIAYYLGSKGSSRMVGWAMNHSHHLDNPIPAAASPGPERLISDDSFAFWCRGTTNSPEIQPPR